MPSLDDYRNLVQFIARDYYELSHDKIKWQRDDWRKRCCRLIYSEPVEPMPPFIVDGNF